MQLELSGSKHLSDTRCLVESNIDGVNGGDIPINVGKTGFVFGGHADVGWWLGGCGWQEGLIITVIQKSSFFRVCQKRKLNK